jgi:hypothetical protein
MSTAPLNPTPPKAAGIEQIPLEWREQIVEWIREEGAWWLASLVVHMFALCILAVITIKVADKMLSDGASFGEVNVEDAEAIEEVPMYDIGDPVYDTAELSPESFILEPLGRLEQDEEYNDDNPIFSPRGGGGAEGNPNMPQLGGWGGFDDLIGLSAGGPAVKGGGGVGTGSGNSPSLGMGADGSGFGARATGYREKNSGNSGATKITERAVNASLNWLARHQNQDGSWTQDDFQKHCKNDTCTGRGSSRQDVGTTALALLPFLAAGQTHKNKGIYQGQVTRAMNYLLRQQDSKNGDLRGQGGTMYAHALATLALCELHGMTKLYGSSGDPKLYDAAQKAIGFIQSAQHPNTGGWRYSPGDPGDTSVTGWIVMALKSAQMAGISVNPAVFEGARKYLMSTSSGYNKEHFSYQPRQNPTMSMTSVGLLCMQYLGARRNDPQIVDGCNYLMGNLPDTENGRHVYYWYYASMVMHNITGPQWDQWNRAMRKTLINTQVREGCAAGSWDPALPTPDQWGSQGGRLMETCLSALTLEVYYRYLPLYKLDAEDDAKPPASAAEPAVKTADKSLEIFIEKAVEKILEKNQ